MAAYKKYFDKDGTELSLREWVVYTGGPEAVVAVTMVTPVMKLVTRFDGKDWGKPDAPAPAWFESLLFDDGEEVEIIGSYRTEAEAEQGHDELVRLLLASRSVVSVGDLP